MGFLDKWWQWLEIVFVTLWEFANICNYHASGVPGDRAVPFGEGFLSLEPPETSVPDHNSNMSTKTDSWASPQFSYSESPGRRGVQSSAIRDSHHYASLKSSPCRTCKPGNFQREPECRVPSIDLPSPPKNRLLHSFIQQTSVAHLLV